jgi:hypothetical protein
LVAAGGAAACSQIHRGKIQSSSVSKCYLRCMFGNRLSTRVVYVDCNHGFS